MHDLELTPFWVKIEGILTLRGCRFSTQPTPAHLSIRHVEEDGRGNRLGHDLLVRRRVEE